MDVEPIVSDFSPYQDNVIRPHDRTNPFVRSRVSNTSSQPDLLPASLLVAQFVQNAISETPLRILFDSGSDVSFITKASLPNNVTPSLGNTRTGTTLAGTLQSNRTVLLRNITLPEFSKHYRIDQQVCHVVDTPCYYDIILGRDFLRKIKMHQDFKTQTMTAFGITQPMRKRESLSSRYDSLLSMFDDPDEWFFTQCFQSNIQ